MNAILKKFHSVLSWLNGCARQFSGAMKNGGYHGSDATAMLIPWVQREFIQVPAESLPDGVTVSNHYQRAPHPDPKHPWPMPDGSVHPARLAETLVELHLHPDELDGSHILAAGILGQGQF